MPASIKRVKTAVSWLAGPIVHKILTRSMNPPAVLNLMKISLRRPRPKVRWIKQAIPGDFIRALRNISEDTSSYHRNEQKMKFQLHLLPATGTFRLLSNFMRFDLHLSSA